MMCPSIAKVHGCSAAQQVGWHLTCSWVCSQACPASGSPARAVSPLWPASGSSAWAADLLSGYPFGFLLALFRRAAWEPGLCNSLHLVLGLLFCRILCFCSLCVCLHRSPVSAYLIYHPILFNVCIDFTCPLLSLSYDLLPLFSFPLHLSPLFELELELNWNYK